MGTSLRPPNDVSSLRPKLLLLKAGIAQLGGLGSTLGMDRRFFLLHNVQIGCGPTLSAIHSVPGGLYNIRRILSSGMWQMCSPVDVQRHLRKVYSHHIQGWGLLLAGCLAYSSTTTMFLWNNETTPDYTAFYPRRQCLQNRWVYSLLLHDWKNE
jgi:hypothetical protein